MGFQGSLRELHLPDVIQLIAVSGKSGAFHMRKDDQEGLIYLQDGQIVHAILGGLTGEEAVYAMGVWNDGAFEFVPDEEPPQTTISKSNTNLLMEAARRMDEWRVLSKKIPDLDYIPEFIVPQGQQSQINLNTQEWLVLSKIDGTKSIEELAATISYSTFDVAKVLYGLATNNLIILKPPAGKSPADAPAAAPVPAAASAPAPAPPAAAPKAAPAAEEAEDEDEEDLTPEELTSIARNIRDEAREVIGDLGKAKIITLYREAKHKIDEGRGEEAILDLCRKLVKAAQPLKGPQGQAILDQRLREYCDF